MSSMYQITIENSKTLKWIYIENKYKNDWNYEGWNIELTNIESIEIWVYDF